MTEKAKGKMKEAAGAITDNKNKKAEGQAQQRAAEAGEEAAQKEKTRQEQAKAKEAERERDKQERKDKGLLGNVGTPCRGVKEAPVSSWAGALGSFGPFSCPYSAECLEEEFSEVHLQDLA